MASTPESVCELTDGARAFSTVLTAIAGSLLTGINNGAGVAGQVAITAWFPAFGIISVSLYGLIVSANGGAFGTREPFLPRRPPSESTASAVLNTNDGAVPPVAAVIDVHASQTFDAFVTSRYHAENAWLTESGVQDDGQAVEQTELLPLPSRPSTITTELAASQPSPGHEDSSTLSTGPRIPLLLHGGRGVDEERGIGHEQPTTARRTKWSPERDEPKVSILGWLVYIYAYIWTPSIHTSWIISNWSKAPDKLLAARAITIGVAALSYTIDTQARYGLALGRRLGSKDIFPRVFSTFTAIITFGLGAEVLVLILRAATREYHTVESKWQWNVILLLVIYFVLTLVVGGLIWIARKGIFDAGMKQTWRGRLAGALVGAILGGIVAAPAIVVMKNSQGARSPPQELALFMGCEKVSWWEKAVQILP